MKSGYYPTSQNKSISTGFLEAREEKEVDIVELLRNNGYGVVEGAVKVRKKIKEVGTENYEFSLDQYRYGAKAAAEKYRTRIRDIEIEGS